MNQQSPPADQVFERINQNLLAAIQCKNLLKAMNRPEVIQAFNKKRGAQSYLQIRNALQDRLCLSLKKIIEPSADERYSFGLLISKYSELLSDEVKEKYRVIFESSEAISLKSHRDNFVAHSGNPEAIAITYEEFYILIDKLSSLLREVSALFGWDQGVNYQQLEVQLRLESEYFFDILRKGKLSLRA